MKKTGIWLDFKEAYIINLTEDGEAVHQHVLSDIEDYHVVGGAPAKTAYGSVNTVSERKYLERKKHQTNEYFNKIMKAVEKEDMLYIFGPAEAKIGLKKMIEQTKSFEPQVRALHTSKKMTEKQMIAAVKDFFKT